MHVGEVERSIRTIKEWVRCSIHDLPFRNYPRVLITGCITYNIKRLNSIPAEDGISDTMSPNTLVTGAQCLDYNELVKLHFGDYVQVHQERRITNNNEPRSVGAIALYPSGNAQQTWSFMSLNTGKRLHRQNWTLLPMGEEVIARVHSLAEREGRKKVTNNFNFEWRPGTVVAEAPTEENCEESPQAGEPKDENQNAQDEGPELSEPMNDEERHKRRR